MDDARPLSERYWYVEGTTATRIDVDAGDFWTQVMSDDPRDEIVRHVLGADGWLVTEYRLDGTMTHEEMHPNGDELHVLVAGRYDLVLVHEAGETVIPMLPGTCANVARGVWHRFVVHEPTTAVSITAGRGTEHRPIPAQENT